ncbi:MAG: GAF domain-containing sensor histidine kinase [Desulfocapsaceae bacterium]|nr:GAF domain-containing sensor histidine kinase [Desulfocapsaceae bacterium]
MTCINDGGKQDIIRDLPEAHFPTNFPVKQYRTTRKLYFGGRPFVQVIDPEDEDLRDHGAWLQSLGVKAVLQLPVIFERNFVGWIPVHSNISREPWSEADIHQANQMANELAIGLRIKELADQARESAILKERAEFAREIHDTLAQDFLGILIQLEVAEELCGKDEEGFREQLARLNHLAKQGLQEARRSIRSLRSPEILSDNLVAMIKRDIKTNLQNVPIFVEESTPFPDIVNDAKYEIYRIVSEALANAVRHADAQEIVVMFTAAPNLSIQIRDDGIGIPSIAQDSQCHGMEIMHERAHKIGAEISIDTYAKSGTTVNVAIPPTLALYRDEGNRGRD